MQWIDYLFKAMALVLGYSLRQQAHKGNAAARKRAIEDAADRRADAKFGERPSP